MKQPQRVILEELHPRDWADIKWRALQVKRSGIVGNDEIRCLIYGFVYWIFENEITIDLEVPSKNDRIQ